MLFVKQRGRGGDWGCQETPLAPGVSICAGAHPSSSPSPVPTVTCGLHSCPLLPVAESSLTGPGSLALPPARVPGRRLQPQRPQTSHLMTWKLAEPFIHTQSPETPQKRPRFPREKVGPGCRSRHQHPEIQAGWTGHHTLPDELGACPRARRGRGWHRGVDGTAGPRRAPPPPPPPSLPGRWGWSAALDSGTCSGRCSPCRCTRPCWGRWRTGSTCRPLKGSRAQRSQITHRSRAREEQETQTGPLRRPSWRSFSGSSVCRGWGGVPHVGAEPLDQRADPRPTAARGP